MRSEIETIRKSLGIGDADVTLADRYRSLIMKIIPRVVGEFYVHMFSVGHERYYRGVDVPRLKSLQIEHWRHLFRAEFDDVYANHATRIGIVHRDRAITPTLYMQSYGWFTSRLAEELVAHPDVPADDRPRLTSVALKLIHLDMTIALAAYEAALVD